MTETNPLHPRRYLHTIHAAPECDRLRHIYCDVFGGITFSENYYAPEDRDAALLYVADHMIEVMAPHTPDDMRFMYARYLAKAGPGYHSISFGVENVEAAQAYCDANGILINTAGPGLIFLHPKSTGGIIMELTEHRMPNDPWDLPNWRRDWAAGRPARPHALAHLVCAPRYPDAAIAFLTGALEGTVRDVTQVDWPQPAIATWIDIADVTLAVLKPNDEAAGPLVAFSQGTNGGLFALAWQVEDADGAAAWFANNHTQDLPFEVPPARSGYSHEFVIDGARHWFAA